MLKITFTRLDKRPFRILCLGAHSDDIEIGCGGTILRLSKEKPDLEIVWIVFSATGERAAEAQISANKFLEGVNEKKIILNQFRDGFFPYSGSDIKDYFESIKNTFSPDLIFTHYHQDLHQDHRLISELTWNTYRDHLILEYEVIKSDGDIGSPNLFVSLDDYICTRKVKHILDTFTSQKGKNWLTEDALHAIMRLRGIEARSQGNYAEAFYARKISL